MDKVFLGESEEVSVSQDTSSHPQYILLMAHGAGAGYYHPFLEKLGSAIASRNGTVIRYNFPYMEKGKKFPGSPKPNIQTIGKLIAIAQETYPDLPVFLSGKSYGGRMSSHWVAENPTTKVKGLVYFGFPLHAPGKESKERATHLYEVSIPQYFIQGTRDSLANFELINQVAKSCKHAQLLPIEHADHSFKAPKKLATMSYDEMIHWIGTSTDNWITSIL